MKKKNPKAQIGVKIVPAGLVLPVNVEIKIEKQPIKDKK